MIDRSCVCVFVTGCNLCVCVTGCNRDHVRTNLRAAQNRWPCANTRVYVSERSSYYFACDLSVVLWVFRAAHAHSIKTPAAALC